MKISKEAIEAVKRRHDLAELVRASGVELKKKGRQWIGRCPFHDDRTPSFFVDSQKQLWNCLGECSAARDGGGDVFRFVMKRDGIDFIEAWKKLGGEIDQNPLPRRKASASAAAIRGPQAVHADPPSPRLRRAGLQVLGRVADFYHRRFLETAQGAAYLGKRGISDPEIYRAFRVGYVDGSLIEKIPASGKLRDDLLEVGVLNPSGKELFAGCVVFPLFDEQGAVVNLYGRSIDRDQHLYLPGPRRGLWNAAILAGHDEVILTESILDALSLIVAGVVNVLPLYGVHGFTSEHETLLRRLKPARVALALDSDEAGRAAGAALSEKLAGLGFAVRTIDLPRKDPNEVLVEDGPEVLKKLFVAPSPLAAVPFLPEDEPETAKKIKIESPPETGVTIDGHELRYASDDRLYTVRGIEAKSGASLRVAMKLVVGETKVIDAVDLYSARSRNAFLSRAVACGCGDRSAIERDLVFLLEEIERRQAKTDEPKPEPLEMTPRDRAEALAFLRRPDLLDQVAADMETLGYVGEETNKQIGYLVAVSRKLEAPLSMVIMSQSGSGKSALADVLETLTPLEDAILFSRLTPQALYYMEKDALRGKFILIEERAGSADADYSIRTLQSKKKLILAVPIKDPATGRIKTQVFEILGPAAFLETTTESRIHHENATRCFEAYCDESAEQTRRIHEAQKRGKTLEALIGRTGQDAIIRRHHNAQRSLEPLGVVIPFAPAIAFPHQWLRTRRDHLRFLNLIESIAFLYQHQREKKRDSTGSLYIEATINDYERAFSLAAELLGQTLSDLKRPAADLLNGVQALIGSKPDGAATRREIREATGLPDHRVIALLADLVALEYLEILSGSQGKTFRYRLASAPTKATEKSHAWLPGLTTPEELRKRWNFEKRDSKFSQRSYLLRSTAVKAS